MLDEIGSRLKPECVVFEVTERVAITEWKEFRAILAELRRRGFAVAIDGMGAATPRCRRWPRSKPTI